MPVSINTFPLHPDCWTRGPNPNLRPTRPTTDPALRVARRIEGLYRDTINRLIDVVKEVKNYTDALGPIEVLRERLQSMDLRISKLQMRPSTHVLEDRLA